MNPSTLGVLKRIEAEGLEYDDRESEHSRKWLNLEPETGSLLSLLLKLSRVHNVLEIGTSTGYSTICIASVLQEQGGRVTTIGRDTPMNKFIGNPGLQRSERWHHDAAFGRKQTFWVRFAQIPAKSTDRLQRHIGVAIGVTKRRFDLGVDVGLGDLGGDANAVHDGALIGAAMADGADTAHA